MAKQSSGKTLHTKQKSDSNSSRHHKKLSPQEKHERKERILTHGAASITRSITDAVVIKDGDIFFLSEPDGSVPLENASGQNTHGLGLYYHDCRYLNGYDLKLAGTVPAALVSTAERGFEAVFQLTNRDIRLPDGSLIAKEELGVKWVRLTDHNTCSLHDLISFQNFTLQEIKFPASITFNSNFEDVYNVRGLLPAEFGELVHPPLWEDGHTLRFLYRGADGLYRSLAIHISPRPRSTEGTTAHLEIALKPHESREFKITITLFESSEQKEIRNRKPSRSEPGKVISETERTYSEWLGANTQIHTDSVLLNQVLDRSLRDLCMLLSTIRGQRFFAAGIPWFVTLFGRDSIIAALQILAFNPFVAESTLRVLAHYQGRKVDPWREEVPGKIHHELRVGEMARAGEIPHTPYYGTVDATPLFIILLCRHAAWTGDLSLFNELRSHVELALHWISDYGDSDGDGFIDYKSSSEKGLINQGWKDSGNAIVNEDGSLATPPIGLVEVQGYVYLAKILLADLYRRVGDSAMGERLEREANELRERFNREYWMQDKGIYALAFQEGHEPVTVVSSNPGHALWAGIADEDKAHRTMERLMAEDMFSGWGVRTLSTEEKRYSPVSYHLGSVWPHDNAIIAAGFRRYGFDEAAHRLFRGILDAAMDFEHYRLPELFSGFSRADFSVPVRYPVACHPQAWGAGAIPYFIHSMLGLEPEAFERRLQIVRPMLPDFVDHMVVNGLRVGAGSVDLRFERGKEGVAVHVLRMEGDLDIVVTS